jgi:hypothetical protein
MQAKAVTPATINSKDGSNSMTGFNRRNASNKQTQAILEKT